MLLPECDGEFVGRCVLSDAKVVFRSAIYYAVDAVLMEERYQFGNVDMDVSVCVKYGFAIHLNLVVRSRLCGKNTHY